MAISDRVRKLLWARSGNQCAFCHRDLTVDRTSHDREAIVGDECHIVSQSPNGPRFDPAFDASQIDDYDNLILLCKTHHKLIDDQPQSYDTAGLRTLKAQHESRIRQLLQDNHVESTERTITLSVDYKKHLHPFGETDVRYIRSRLREKQSMLLEVDIDRDALSMLLDIPIWRFGAAKGSGDLRHFAQEIRAHGASEPRHRELFANYVEMEDRVMKLEHDICAGLVELMTNRVANAWVLSDGDLVLAMRAYVSCFFIRNHQGIEIEWWPEGNPGEGWKMRVYLSENEFAGLTSRVGLRRGGSYLDFSHEQLMQMIVPRIVYIATRRGSTSELLDGLLDLRKWNWRVSHPGF